MSQRLDDGFSTIITFSENPSVKLWEKSVTPPGISAGGEVDTTTMRNTAWRTRNPKQLKTLTECTFSAAYDPAAIDECMAMVGVNQEITITFPDGDELAFWGWLDEFAPGDHVEGEQPEAECTIIPSNQDDTGAEVAPVRTAA